MFSKACEYGIKAMIHIAYRSQKGNRTSLKEVAKAIDSPIAFTAKILQTLAKDNLIISVKGAGGGYELHSEQSTRITLQKIVSSIDGDEIFEKCGLGLKECNETKPCPAHFKFKHIRNNLNEMLQMTTVSDLTTKLNSGTVFLKI